MPHLLSCVQGLWQEPSHHLVDNDTQFFNLTLDLIALLQWGGRRWSVLSLTHIYTYTGLGLSGLSQACQVSGSLSLSSFSPTYLEKDWRFPEYTNSWGCPRQDDVPGINSDKPGAKGQVSPGAEVAEPGMEGSARLQVTV